MPQQALVGQVQKIKKPIKYTSKGMPQSLLDKIIDEPDSFVSGLAWNSNVKDYKSFCQAFNNHLGKSSSGSGLKKWFFQDLDMENLRIVFNSRTIKTTIERNIGTEAMKKVYEQEEQSASPSIVMPVQQKLTITVPVQIKVAGYQRAGKPVHAYKRGRYPSLTQPQKTFFQTRRAKGLKFGKVLGEYRQAFSQDMRSNSSIKTHYYRFSK